MSVPSSPPYQPEDASNETWSSNPQKLVTLKLPSKLLQQAASKLGSSRGTTPESNRTKPPGSGARSRSRRAPGTGASTPSLSQQPALNPPSSPIGPDRQASPTPTPTPKQAAGAGAGPTATTNTGGARGSANVATNAALRALDRTGTPVRHWSKVPIKLKSFTGIQYTISTWSGGPRDESTEFGHGIEEEPATGIEEGDDMGTPSGAATPIAPSTPNPQSIGGPAAKRNGGSLLAQSPMTPSSFSPGV